MYLIFISSGLSTHAALCKPPYIHRTVSSPIRQTHANLQPTISTQAQSYPHHLCYSLPSYSLRPLCLAASLIRSSSSNLLTASMSVRFLTSLAFSVPTPSSCLTLFCVSGGSITPWRRSDSLRQLICPPSASRCFWALRFAAWMDVRA